MSLANRSDEELLAAYKDASADEKDAIAGELFGRHYNQVARWCCHFMGSQDAAVDVAQNVFLKAHVQLQAFRGNARFSTWLYSIVRHEALNALRRVEPAMEGEEVLNTLPTLEAGPEEVAVSSSRARQLTAFLSATLDETERVVFTLHYGDEVPLDSITRLLRLHNASGAKAYIVSAKRKLARAARQMRLRGAVS
jgi:RNA polymerase sigma-70 factor (ECF subfamily)